MTWLRILLHIILRLQVCSLVLLYDDHRAHDSVSPPCAAAATSTSEKQVPQEKSTKPGDSE